jgi:hypothetical protein
LFQRCHHHRHHLETPRFLQGDHHHLLDHLRRHRRDLLRLIRFQYLAVRYLKQIHPVHRLHLQYEKYRCSAILKILARRHHHQS